MKRQIKKLSALAVVAALAAAVGVGAYLSLTPPATHASGPNGDWGIPDIRDRSYKPPEISANDVETQSGKFAWHQGARGGFPYTHCPTKVGFLGTYHTIAEAEIRVDGPPGQRLLQVPVRIGDNQLCGQHTVYFSTVDNETQERAEHGKDYLPVTNGHVVFEQGQTVGLAEVWIKGDKIIEDKESFDLVITGMTWDDTGYKTVNLTPERTKPPYTIKTAEDGQQSARMTAQWSGRKISVYPDIQIARVTINSLHGSGDGWTEQGEKRPLPAEVRAFGADSRGETRIFEGQSAKFTVAGSFRRWPDDSMCNEDITVDWTTKEIPYGASAYYHDYVANSGTVTLKPGRGSFEHLDDVVIRVKTLHDHVREDTEKFEVELSNLRGGCGARFKEKGSHALQVHIQDASPADAPLEQALQDSVVTPYGAYTTDGHELSFRIELSHQVDEEIVVDYETVEQYNKSRKWEAKKNRNYHHRSGKITFPARDESLYRVVTVPTTHREISQPQLIQSVQLNISVRRGPGKVSTSRVTGLIYDSNHTGTKSVTQSPQQYDPQPQPDPTPTPAPTATPTPSSTQPQPVRPDPTGDRIGWATSKVSITEGQDTVDIPFDIPEALVRAGYVDIGIAHAEDGNIPASRIRDLRFTAAGLRGVVMDYNLDDDVPMHNVARLQFRKGQDSGLKIKIQAPQDGKVEGDEVLWLVARNVWHDDDQAGRVRWDGKQSVKITIKDKDVIPGVVPRVDFLPHPNLFPGRQEQGREVLEGNEQWKMRGTVTFDSPLPAPVTVHAAVRCKICTRPNTLGPGNSHKTINNIPLPISLKAGDTRATFEWTMYGNTKVNSGWTLAERYLIFGLTKIEGDVFVVDHTKMADDSGEFRYELLLDDDTQPFGDTVPTLLFETLFIRDDDHESSLSLQEPDPQVEGRPLKFTVLRNGDTSQAVTVNYETTAGTATPGIDYVEDSGSLTIAANESEAVIEVETFRDLFVEGAETVGMKISSETTVQRSNVQGTIVDLGNLAHAIQMSLGEPEASKDGTAVFVPLCIDFDRVTQGKLQDMHFQWGVSDDKSVKNTQTAVTAPPRETCLGYITLSSK